MTEMQPEMLSFAAQSDIIRACQKDEYQLSVLKRELGSLLNTFPSAFWGNLRQRWRNGNGPTKAAVRQTTPVRSGSGESVSSNTSGGSGTPSPGRSGSDHMNSPLGAMGGSGAVTPLLESNEEASPNAIFAQFEHEIELICDLLYYAAATIMIKQTLGEEYTDLMLVNIDGKSVPSLAKRILQAVLHSVPFYALRKVLSRYSSQEVDAKSREVTSQVRDVLIPNLLRLHLIIFFLRPHFLHLSKRFARVRYASLLASSRSTPGRNSFLAVLLLIQFLVASRPMVGFSRLALDFLARLVEKVQTFGVPCILASKKSSSESVKPASPKKTREVPTTDCATHSDAQACESAELEVAHTGDHSIIQALTRKAKQNLNAFLASLTEKPREEGERQLTLPEGNIDTDFQDSDNSDAVAPKCSFCLSNCVVPTATRCGHVFCWTCIASWCSTNPTCPLCRANSLPQELIPLRHYSPSTV